jgi:hypothetical protein
MAPPSSPSKSPSRSYHEIIAIRHFAFFDRQSQCRNGWRDKRGWRNARVKFGVIRVICGCCLRERIKEPLSQRHCVSTQFPAGMSSMAGSATASTGVAAAASTEVAATAWAEAAAASTEAAATAESRRRHLRSGAVLLRSLKPLLRLALESLNLRRRPVLLRR